MKRQLVLLAVLIVVIGLGILQYKKVSGSLVGGSIGELISGVFSDKASLSSRTLEQAQAEQTAREEEENGPPKSYPNPEFLPCTAEEMFPYPADVKPLMETVALPEKRKPVVYFAFATNEADKYTTEATILRDLIKFQIRSTGGGELLLNNIPNARMMWINRKADFNVQEVVSRDEFLKDARAQDSDVMVTLKFNGTGENANLKIMIEDLKSSRTENLNSVDEGYKSVPEIVGWASEKIALFCGIDPASLEKARFKDQILSAKAFDQVTSQPIAEQSFESRIELVRAEPDCPYLYSESTGTTSCVQLVDLGLKRFPEDPRLIAEKLHSLNDAESTASLISFLGESIRRYPDDFFMYGPCYSAMVSVFPSENNPHQSPPELKTLVKQYGLYAEKYKDSWSTRWAYAWSLQQLAAYMRGGKTIDRVPDDVLAERSIYLRESFNVAAEQWKKFPDSPTILDQILEFDGDVRRLTRTDRIAIARKLEEVNPKSVSMELTQAQENSIGYGQQADYFKVIDRAVKRHAGDPVAMAAIANALRHEGWRQVGWKKMTEEELLKSSNPYANRFWDAAEYVYSQNGSLNKECDSFYYALAEARGRTDRIEEWKQSGKNSCFSFRLAHDAHSAGDWETCLKHAMASYKENDMTEEKHQCLYYIVKSLWKLKRYDESLNYARKGILKFPKRQTFFYMYAIVALQAGKNLETAYDCAWTAVDFGTGNQGCNDTFEKLRAKLNKPNHPALIAMKN